VHDSSGRRQVKKCGVVIHGERKHEPILEVRGRRTCRGLLKPLSFWVASFTVYTLQISERQASNMTGPMPPPQKNAPDLHESQEQPLEKVG